MTNARKLSNRLAELLQKERHALAEFLIELAAFDRERRWVELEHSSLFNYLHRDLGLSKGAAFYRMKAAQLLQRHPEVVEPLRDGRLCFTSIVELARVATAENIAAVLPRFFHVSKSEAKEVAAELNPTPAPARTVVTAVRAPVLSPTLALAVGRSELSEASEVRTVDAGVHPDELAAAPEPRPRAMTVEPRTAEQSRLSITVSRTLLKKLAAARDALSHSHPGASEAEILEAGLDLLLERSAKRKGLVKNPRPAPSTTPPARSRYVPAHVRREVWKRDEGRCQWRMEDGSACGSTQRVQLDHVRPFARGGASTAGELRCLCQAHNDRAARDAFGDAGRDRCTGRRRLREDGFAFRAGRASPWFTASRLWPSGSIANAA